MQHERAVGINDAFGMTGRAGGEAHGGTVVFIDWRISKIIAGIGKQVLVIQEAFGNSVASIRNDNGAFERRILTKFFIQGKEHIVD